MSGGGLNRIEARQRMTDLEVELWETITMLLLVAKRVHPRNICEDGIITKAEELIHRIEKLPAREGIVL